MKRRIVEYYERMLVVRATPATSPWQQRRALRTTPAEKPADTADAENVDPENMDAAPESAEAEAEG